MTNRKQAARIDLTLTSAFWARGMSLEETRLALHDVYGFMHGPELDSWWDKLNRARVAGTVQAGLHLVEG